MPTGVIVNALAVLIGGIVGGVGGKYLSEKFKTEINMIFGLASMTMGIIAIAPTKNMAAVIFCFDYWNRGWVAPACECVD